MSSPPQCLTNWTLSEPQLCGVTGLAHHGGQQKAAVLLWHERTLVTHIFRGCREAVHDNLAPAKTHVMQLPDVHADDDPPADADIVQVLAGMQETCVLTSDGRLYTCEMSPSCRLQPLTGARQPAGTVRSACVTHDGGFALVCSTDASLCVHVLPAAFDADAADRSGWGRRFDISFEPNQLQSTWQTSRFCVRDLAPVADTTGRSARFFRLLRTDNVDQQCDATPTAETAGLFLVIDNQLLALIGPPDRPDECGLRVVHTCSAPIRSFWLAGTGDALFVLLDSGALDVLHASALLDDASLHRTVLSFGDSVACAAMHSNTLVYSTGFEVVLVWLQLHPASDQFAVAGRRAVRLCGVIAAAFMPAADRVLLLTENRFLYSVPWQAHFVADAAGAADDCALHRVDDAFMLRGQQQLDEIVRMTADYQHVQRQLADLTAQQYVLRLAERLRCGRPEDATIAAPPFVARVSASKTLPSSAGTHTIYAGRRQRTLFVSRDSYFVNISLRLVGTAATLKEWNLSADDLWTLCVHESHPTRSTTTVRCVRLHVGMFEDDQRTVEILLNTSCPPDFLSVPDVTLALQAFVRTGADFQLLSFAVPCEPIDVALLFSLHPAGDRAPPFARSEAVFGGQAPFGALLLTYRMRLAVDVSWSGVLALVAGRSNCERLAESAGQSVYVCLLERWVRLGVEQGLNGERMLCLSAADAGALYQVKLRLLAGLYADGDRRPANRPSDTVIRDILNTEQMAKELVHTKCMESLLQSLANVRLALSETDAKC